MGNGSPDPVAPTLFLLNSLTVGGSEKKIVAIVNALHGQGHAVHLAYLNAPETLRGEIGPSVPVLPLRRSGKLSLPVARRLVRHVRAHGVRRIVAVNLYPLLYAFTASVLCPSLDYVALVNTTTHRDRRNGRFMYLYAPLLRRATRIVFGSGRQAADWIREHALDPRRCTTIYNGVDAERFSPYGTSEEGEDADGRCASGIPSNAVLLGTVGAMRPEKAQSDLLRAAARLPSSTGGRPLWVILVGDGETRAELERCAAEAGMADRVVFRGNLDDVRAALGLMDVFAMTSVAVETFSNAALEAMAMAKPVVLSDIGGAREMVGDRECGLVYPPGDVDALCRALGMLIEDEILRQRMGLNARARILECFTFERMVRDYAETVLGIPTGQGAVEPETDISR